MVNLAPSSHNDTSADDLSIRAAPPASGWPMTGTFERTRYYTTRPRKVPPEFCSDELLEACSLVAALLLVRIICQADDQGRLPGTPKYLRAVCFPLRPEISVKKVEVALGELIEAGFVLRYAVKGRTFIQVARWQDLQGKWGRRAYPSRYPAPPGWANDWVSVASEEESSAL